MAMNLRQYVQYIEKRRLEEATPTVGKPKGIADNQERSVSVAKDEARLNDTRKVSPSPAKKPEMGGRKIVNPTAEVGKPAVNKEVMQARNVPVKSIREEELAELAPFQDFKNSFVNGFKKAYRGPSNQPQAQQAAQVQPQTLKTGAQVNAAQAAQPQAAQAAAPAAQAQPAQKAAGNQAPYLPGQNMQDKVPNTPLHNPKTKKVIVYGGYVKDLIKALQLKPLTDNSYARLGGGDQVDNSKAGDDNYDVYRGDMKFNDHVYLYIPKTYQPRTAPKNAKQDYVNLAGGSLDDVATEKAEKPNAILVVEGLMEYVETRLVEEKLVHAVQWLTPAYSAKTITIHQPGSQTVKASDKKPALNKEVMQARQVAVKQVRENESARHTSALGVDVRSINERANLEMIDHLKKAVRSIPEAATWIPTVRVDETAKPAKRTPAKGAPAKRGRWI